MPDPHPHPPPAEISGFEGRFPHADGVLWLLEGVRRRLDRRIVRTVRRRVERAGFTSIGSVFTYTSPRELAALYRLAQQVPAGGRVVEFGSHLGASTAYLLAGTRDRKATVVAVDTWRNETMPEGEQDTFAQFRANTAAGADRLETVRAKTAEVSADELGHADLVFIDADHSYAAASADFRLAARLLTDRGVIAFHDSIVFSGVSRTIGEALAEGRWAVIGQADSLFWACRRSVLPIPPADLEPAPEPDAADATPAGAT